MLGACARLFRCLKPPEDGRLAGVYALNRERMKDADRPSPAQGAADRKLPTRPRDEIARLGDEIYERDIRPQVDVDHHGEYVAVDIDSGSWAISDDLRAAAKHLRTQHPGANDVWLLRVGYRALHRLGGLTLRSAR